MIENPVSGRAVIKQEYDSISVEIPAKKNWFLIVFMTFWLGGWAMGEYSAIKAILSMEAPLFANAFLLFWLMGWTIGGGFAFYSVLWQLIGREIIRIESGFLTIGKSAAGIGKKKEYEINLIKNIDIMPGPHVRGVQFKGKIPGFTGSRIKFDYEKKTIYFARDIDEAEAQMIINRFRQSPYLRSENFASDKSSSY